MSNQESGLKILGAFISPSEPDTLMVKFKEPKTGVITHKEMWSREAGISDREMAALKELSKRQSGGSSNRDGSQGNEGATQFIDWEDVKEQAKSEEKKQLIEEIEKDVLTENKEESQSAVRSCEICNNSNLKCLCQLTLTDNQNNKIFEWKDGASDDLKNLIFSGGGLNDQVSFEIKGTCTNNHTSCSNLYYVDVTAGHSPIKVEEKTGCAGDIKLVYNQDLLAKNDENTFNYISYENKAVKEHTDECITNNGKWPKIILTDANKKDHLEGLDNKLVLKWNYIRIFNFLFTSDLSMFPATKYHIGALECLDPIKTVNGYSIDSLIENDQLSYLAFTKAETQIDSYTLPHYSVALNDFSLDFNADKKSVTGGKDGFGNDLKSEADQVNALNDAIKKYTDAPSSKNIKSFQKLIPDMKGSFNETFHQSHVLTFESDNTLKKTLDVAVESARILTSIFKLISTLKYIQSEIHKLLKIKKDAVKKLGAGEFKLIDDPKIFFPKVTFSGNARIENNKLEDTNNNSSKGSLRQFNYHLKRENVRVYAEKAFGIELKIDIIDVILSITTGPIAPFASLLKTKQHGITQYSADLSLAVSAYLALDASFESSNLCENNIKLTNSEVISDLGLTGKIEYGIHAILFHGVLTSKFLVKGAVIAGFTASVEKGLGWYLGTSGAALYYQINYKMGLGGVESDEEKNKKRNKTDALLAKEKEYMTTEELKAAKERSQKNITAFQDKHDEIMRDAEKNQVWKDEKLLAEHRAKLDEWDKWNAARDEVVQNEKMKQNRIDELIAADTQESRELSEQIVKLTNQYSNNGGLTSKENSDRLRLMRELHKLRKDKKISGNPAERLPADVESQLYQDRLDELNSVIQSNDYTMGEIKSAKKERDLLMEDPDNNYGKLHIMDAGIMASDNLDKKAEAELKKRFESYMDPSGHDLE